MLDHDVVWTTIGFSLRAAVRGGRVFWRLLSHKAGFARTDGIDKMCQAQVTSRCRVFTQSNLPQQKKPSLLRSSHNTRMPVIPAVEFTPVNADPLINARKRGKPFILTSALGTLSLGKKEWVRYYQRLPVEWEGRFPVKLVTFSAQWLPSTSSAASSSSSRPNFTVHATYGCIQQRRRTNIRLNCYYKHAGTDTWKTLSNGPVEIRDGTQFSPSQDGDRAIMAVFRDVEADHIKSIPRSLKRQIPEYDGEEDDDEEDEDDEKDQKDTEYTETNDDGSWYPLQTSKAKKGQPKAVDIKGKGKGKAKMEVTSEIGGSAAKRNLVAFASHYMASGRKIKDTSDEDFSDGSDADLSDTVTTNDDIPVTLPACPPPTWHFIATKSLHYSYAYDSSLKKIHAEPDTSSKYHFAISTKPGYLVLVRDCDESNPDDMKYWNTYEKKQSSSWVSYDTQPKKKGFEAEATNVLEPEEKKTIEMAYWTSSYPPIVNDMDKSMIYKNQIILGPKDVTVNWFVDTARLDYNIRYGLPVPYRRLIFDAINEPSETPPIEDSAAFDNPPKQTEIVRAYDTVLRPYSTEGPPPKQPKGLSTSLKSYQLRAVGWMLEVEDGVRRRKGWSTESLARLEGSESWFDVEKKRFYLNKRPPHTMRSHGAILADEMGLGKTMEILGVILGNPSPLKSIFRSRGPNWWCNEDDEAWLFPSSATLILAPSHLIIQWKGEIEKHISKNMKVIVITTKPQFAKVSYKALMTADVVLISFQFLKNKACLKAVESFEVGRDILNEAGVHAASSAAAAVGTDEDGTPDRRGESARMNAIVTSAMELKRHKNALTRTSPVLEHIHWWRIVVDEGHEILNDHESVKSSWRPSKVKRNPMLDLVLGFRSIFRWYVTGSPFPHGVSSLVGALKFLGWSFTEGRSRRWASSGFDYNEVVGIDHGRGEDGDRPLRREDGENFEAGDNGEEGEGENREDGSGDTHGPTVLSKPRAGAFLKGQLHKMIREHLYFLLLEMAAALLTHLILHFPVERGIYAAAVARSSWNTDSVRLRQLCCHLQISEQDRTVIGETRRTLKEIREIMVEHVRDSIERQTKLLDRYRVSLQEKNADLAEARALSKPGAHTTQISSLENQIKYIKNSMGSTEREIVQLESERTYFESIIDTISHSTDENCAICMDVIKNMTITTCAHLFCMECIRPWVEKQQRCPACRKSLTLRGLTEVAAEEVRQEIDENHRRLVLQDKYGTKMARLITYIEEQLEVDANARFIVFSQWDTLLHKIGDTLSENGIKNCYVRGNVHMRTNAIQNFKKDENIRVIMLSLDNAASGTNLIEATHILLLDPVAGTAEQARAVEGQAIGRAHRLGQDKQITVVRFIVRDTVEYDLYLRNIAAAAASRKSNEVAAAEASEEVVAGGSSA
ncbi:hypothetical protein BC938DRAFT_482876 [Jimgerdemannia flammicorona]|uniref:SNF2 family N-terminal domain-containing protein n=1 Tax=Jimgerdemannia flammicorona TaxID=994334 RepID=A0A433QW15_9FUNG|nr:hypothetical protein BC938DRAFT_482876 [Jimgerdemannia flammicorona]